MPDLCKVEQKAESTTASEREDVDSYRRTSDHTRSSRKTILNRTMWAEAAGAGAIGRLAELMGKK